MPDVTLFFEACAQGSIEVLRELLASDPSLVRVTDPGARHQGWTGLHTAGQHGQGKAVRLLIEHGADPNAREAGDNTYPLHWAAAGGHLDAVRALLDAGADVHGCGDVHQMDVIGWATIFHAPGGGSGASSDVLPLLLERGGRHHIFSAISAGDLEVIQKLVEQNPEALDRRMSRFEHGQTPLHFALSRNRYDILDLLIKLGADPEAEDQNGHTALEDAMLRGDRAAMSRLLAAGAKPPARPDISNFQASLAPLAESIQKCVSMIRVPDVGQTLDWYARRPSRRQPVWQPTGRRVAGGTAAPGDPFGQDQRGQESRHQRARDKAVEEGKSGQEAQRTKRGDSG